MELLEYIQKEKIKLRDLALVIGYGEAYLLRIAKGLQRPGTKLIKSIEEITDKQVTGKDLLEAYEKGHIKKFCPCCKQFHN